MFCRVSERSLGGWCRCDGLPFPECAGIDADDLLAARETFANFDIGPRLKTQGNRESDHLTIVIHGEAERLFVLGDDSRFWQAQAVLHFSGRQLGLDVLPGPPAAIFVRHVNLSRHGS